MVPTHILCWLAAFLAAYASLKAAGPWCGKSVAGFWMATWLALERQTCGQKPLHSLKSHLKPAASSLSPAFAAPDAPRGLHFGSSWCPTMEDYYKLLGVEPLASSKEIGKAPRPLESLASSSAYTREAFRQLARKVHPDKLPPGSSEEAQLRAKQRFQQVAKAWEVLGDEVRRRAYDAERAAQAQQTRAFEEGLKARDLESSTYLK